MNRNILIYVFLFKSFYFIEVSNQNLTDTLKILIKEAISDDNCSNNIRKYYFNDTESYHHFDALIDYSSKMKNDVGSFINCQMKIHDNSPEYTYFIFQNYESIFHENQKVFFGLCLLNICEDEEYKKIFLKINEILGDFFIKNNSNLEVYNLQKEKDKYKINREKILILLLYSIPLIIMIIQLSFFVFPKLSIFFFRWTVTNSAESIILNSKSKSILSENLINREESNSFLSPVNKKDLFQIESCFSFQQNTENIMNLQINNNSLYNDTGINYIKGIRGFSMIFFIFGNIFIILLHFPVIRPGINIFEFLKENYLGILIIFCLRHIPKIFLSSSGFNLSFKLLCYFDDKLAYESENLSDIESSDDENPSLEILNIQKSVQKLYKTKIFQRNLLNEKDPSKIKLSDYFNFLFIHLYKPFIFILICFYFKYTLQYFIYSLTNFGPLLLVLIKNILDKIECYEIFSHFFLLQDIINLFKLKPQNDFMNVFWLTISEINFTILGSFIVFIGYKNKLSIDYFIVFVIFFICLIKIFYLITHHYSSEFSSFFEDILYGFYSNNQIFGFNFYLIGLFFGLVNYTIQKEIKYKDALHQGKKYLMLPIYFKRICLSSYYVMSNFSYIMMIIIGIIFGFSFSFIIYFQYADYVFKIFSIFDIEVFLFFFHIVLFLSYLKGDNKLFIFLSNKTWIIFNRLYYSFSYLCIPIIIFILYQSETRIKFSYFSFFFYALISGLIIFAFCLAVYIVFELPYRKILKVYLQIKKENNAKIKKFFSLKEK